MDDFSTFYAIDEKKTRLKLHDFNMVTEDLLPKFNFYIIDQPRQTMSFAQIVQEIFDEKFLDSLIKFNIEKCPIQGIESKCLPKVFYRNNEGK